MTSPAAFSFSALTPSAPGAFSDFMLSIADFTSFDLTRLPSKHELRWLRTRFNKI